MASDTIRHRKKRAFLAAYAEAGNVALAADAAQIHRSTHYAWLAEDPAYADAYDAANDEASDRLEQEARRRAVEGVERPVYQGGKQVGSVREYSDTLLIFLLKGVRPEKYRERVSVITEDALDAEIRRLEAEVGRRAAAGEGSPSAGAAR